MALGQTNISIAVVQSAIGVTSTSSVGGLIAKAASGGVGGYAFYINETYGTTGYRNGYLISGAAPHWNMWSNKIPAEWNDDTGDLSLRLKRNTLNAQGGYDFRLHDFRGYDHAAHTPSLVSASEVDTVSGAMSIGFNIYFGQVSFPANITHILARLTVGTYTENLLIPLSAIQNPAVYTPQGYGFDITGIPETTTSGQIQFFGSNSAGYQICTLNNILLAATGLNGTRGFTINHIAQELPKLSKYLDVVWDEYVQINAYITNPYSQDGLSIILQFGITSISNISITINAYSETIADATVALYFYAQGVSTFIGYYNVAASPGGADNYVYVSSVSLNSPAAANEVYYFYIDSITY